MSEPDAKFTAVPLPDGYAFCQVVEHEAVVTLSANGYRILAIVPHEDLVAVVDDAPGSAPYYSNPVRRIEITRNSSSYAPGKNGVERHLVVRSARYVMGLDIESALTKGAQDLAKVHDELRIAKETIMSTTLDLEKAKTTAADLAKDVEFRISALTKRAETVPHLKADLIARTAEVTLMSRIIDTLRAHIGQREYDRLFPKESAT